MTSQLIRVCLILIVLGCVPIESVGQSDSPPLPPPLPAAPQRQPMREVTREDKVAGDIAVQLVVLQIYNNFKSVDPAGIKKAEAMLLELGSEILPTIEEGLGSSDNQIRISTIKILHKIGNEKSLAPLCQALKKESNPRIAESIKAATTAISERTVKARSRLRGVWGPVSITRSDRGVDSEELKTLRIVFSGNKLTLLEGESEECVTFVVNPVFHELSFSITDNNEGTSRVRCFYNLMDGSLKMIMLHRGVVHLKLKRQIP